MNALILAGSLIAILAYFPLWNQIGKSKVEQNLLTHSLWAVLDLVAAATIIVQDGNSLLLIVYFICSTITALFIVKSKGRMVWTRFESFVVSMTIASMIVWYSSGSKMATVASTIALIAAGIPQLVDAWKKPHIMPLLVFCAFLTANLLSTAGGADWSIKERFYPASSASYCFLLVVFSSRKLWLKPIPNIGR